MPIKIKDEEGNEVEVFTKEDIDSTLSEKLEEQKKTLTEEFNTRFEEAGKKEEGGGADKNTQKKEDGGADEPPQWFKDWQTKQDEQFNQIKNNQSKQFVDGVVRELDADKQKEVQEKYESLSGYDETPEGYQRRAEDAYTLVVGQRPESTGFDMSNLNAGTGGRSQHSESHQTTEADQQIQKALGITPDDAKKYGKEGGNEQK